MPEAALALGLSTSVLGPGSLPHRLALLGGRGIRWVEIHGYTRAEFDYADPRLAGATARALARYGLALWSCHSPAEAPLDISAADPEVRRHSVDVMRRAMETSARLGARVFVCDAVRPGEDAADRDARRAPYAESLLSLLRAARALGLRLTIENHSRARDQFSTPEDFAGLVRQYGLDGLGACWDTGHGWIAGAAPEAACRLGAALVTLHIHDNDGRRDRHRLPTAGTAPNWKGFVACLRAIGYAGPFMMEVVSPEHISNESVTATVSEAVKVYRRLVQP
jgi:sugar phosphate isomerase/epimerase